METLSTIKNELVGNEVEAIDFIQKSLTSDTVNQYHLFCFIRNYV